MIITREKILEERCNNYRTVIEDLCRRNGLTVFTEVIDYYINGNLSINDARYLCRACDFEDSIDFDKAEKSPVGVLPREKRDQWFEELIEILGRMEKTNE